MATCMTENLLGHVNAAWIQTVFSISALYKWGILLITLKVTFPPPIPCPLHSDSYVPIEATHRGEAEGWDWATVRIRCVVGVCGGRCRGRIEAAGLQRILKPRGAEIAVRLAVSCLNKEQKAISMWPTVAWPTQIVLDSNARKRIHTHTHTHAHTIKMLTVDLHTKDMLIPGKKLFWNKRGTIQWLRYIKHPWDFWGLNNSVIHSLTFNCTPPDALCDLHSSLLGRNEAINAAKKKKKTLDGSRMQLLSLLYITWAWQGTFHSTLTHFNTNVDAFVINIYILNNPN